MDDGSLDLRRVPGSRRGDEDTSAVKIAKRMAIDQEMHIIVDEDL
jgi:hypothetical protein